jgi:hypothetical protein
MLTKQKFSTLFSVNFCLLFKNNKHVALIYLLLTNNNSSASAGDISEFSDLVN